MTFPPLSIEGSSYQEVECIRELTDGYDFGMSDSSNRLYLLHVIAAEAWLVGTKKGLECLKKPRGFRLFAPSDPLIIHKTK